MKKTIIITTGGTGGHMYPAIKTGAHLHNMGNTIHIFTDTRGVKWCDTSGVDTLKNIIAIPSRAVVGQSVAFKIISLLIILWGFFVALRHINRLKPDAVIGFGGYASVPVLFACVAWGVPVFLHEQNAYAGRVNRLFSKWAKRVAVSFSDTRGLARDICTYTGNPIRTDIASIYDIPYTADADKIRVLITGGSQGAKVFGEVVPQLLIKYANTIQVMQQVRMKQLDTVSQFYKQAGIIATVTPFIEDMVSALQWADIAIARSGAGTVMENACAGVPTVFVPYKYAADNHQYYNAIQFTGGVVVTETQDLQNLLQKQLDLLILDMDAYTRRMDLSAQGKQFFVPQAEYKIAHMVQTYFTSNTT